MRRGRWRRGAAVVLVLWVGAVAGGCAGLGGGGGEITQASDDAGHAELVLEAVDVWGADVAGAPEALEVDGGERMFRVLEDANFERAWVRLGLFWHSLQKFVMLPVVVAGPAVEVSQVRVMADGERWTLKPAENFSFTPGRRPFDKELSAGVFVLPFEALERMAGAEEVEVVVVTNRGGLRVHPNVVAGRGEADLRASALLKFAEFWRRREALL